MNPRRLRAGRGGSRCIDPSGCDGQQQGAGEGLWGAGELSALLCRGKHPILVSSTGPAGLPTQTDAKIIMLFAFAVGLL